MITLLAMHLPPLPTPPTCCNNNLCHVNTPHQICKRSFNSYHYHYVSAVVFSLLSKHDNTCGLGKPKLSQAKPKPGLWGQAVLEQHYSCFHNDRPFGFLVLMGRVEFYQWWDVSPCYGTCIIIYMWLFLVHFTWRLVKGVSGFELRISTLYFF